MAILHLACASDAAYAPHSAAMIHSALSFRGDADLHVHYLVGPRFPSEATTAISEMVRHGGGAIDFITVADEDIAGLPGWAHISATMWYRILLPELLPEVDQILYLDCDTIAMDSLEPLANLEMGTHFIAAVTNVFEPVFAHRPDELGVPTKAYFNSGVIMMNLDEMRRGDCSRQLLDYGRRNRDQLLWPDQDTLNVILGPRRLALDPRWNCMNSVMAFPWSPQVLGERAVAEARANPAIRHFEGPLWNKPWHYLCPFPHRDAYLLHRRGTPWPRVRMEGVTARNRLRRTVRDARSVASRWSSRLRRPPVSA